MDQPGSAHGTAGAVEIRPDKKLCSLIWLISRRRLLHLRVSSLFASLLFCFPLLHTGKLGLLSRTFISTIA